VGCGKSSTPSENSKEDAVVSEEETAQKSTDLEKKPDGEHKRDRKNFAGMMRGGPLQVLHQALDQLDLSADQKASVDKAFEGAKADAADTASKDTDKPEAFKAFLADVAKQVRAGDIDEPGLLAKASGLEKAGPDDAKRETMAKTLQAVHDILTPEQRTKLATDLQSKLDGMFGRMRGPEKRGIDDKGGADKHGPAGFMLHGIDVTDEQKQAIQTALEKAGLGDAEDEMRKKGDEMQSQLKATLEAFKADKFDAAASMPKTLESDGHFQKMVKSLKVIVPLLDQEQRTALADRIEKGMEARGGFAPGRHGFKGGKKAHEEED